MNANRTKLILVVAMLSGCTTTSLSRVDYDNENRQRLTESAEQGEANAQYELGMTYCCGTGFYSTSEAIKWWCRAAKQDHKLAMQKLREHLPHGMTDGCRHHDPANDYAFANDEME